MYRFPPPHLAWLGWPSRYSHSFYDHLGHEVADEMVEWFNQVDAAYRNELREINELNFARFDAKLEQRFAEQELRLEKRFHEQDLRFEKRFTDQDQRLADGFREQDRHIQARFSAMESKISELSDKMQQRHDVQIRSMVGMWVTVIGVLIAMWVRG